MVASSPWLDIRRGDRVREDATDESDSPADAATESNDGSDSDETKTNTLDSVDATRQPRQTDTDLSTSVADQPADD